MSRHQLVFHRLFLPNRAGTIPRYAAGFTKHPNLFQDQSLAAGGGDAVRTYVERLWRTVRNPTVLIGGTG